MSSPSLYLKIEPEKYFSSIVKSLSPWVYDSLGCKLVIRFHFVFGVCLYLRLEEFYFSITHIVHSRKGGNIGLFITLAPKVL